MAEQTSVKLSIKNVDVLVARRLKSRAALEDVTIAEYLKRLIDNEPLGGSQ